MNTREQNLAIARERAINYSANQPLNLKELRKKLGLTQEQAASLVGISREYFNRMEAGRCSIHPRMEIIIRAKLVA